DADTETVRNVNLPESLGGAGEEQPEGDQQDAAKDDALRPEAIRDGAADGAEREVEEAREREDEGHVAARGIELIAERVKERRERIGGAERDEEHPEGRR